MEEKCLPSLKQMVEAKFGALLTGSNIGQSCQNLKGANELKGYWVLSLTCVKTGVEEKSKDPDGA